MGWRQGVTLAISRYQVEKEIARGGAGVVYRGWDPDAERPVAIKVLQADAFNSPVSQRRFQREVETMLRLDHPTYSACWSLESTKGTPILSPS